MNVGLSFAVSALCVASALGQPNDWRIVPGKRIGPITAITSRADLDRSFGKTNVRDQSVDTGEGPEPATVIFPKMPATALAILWVHDRISRVLVCYQHQAGTCKWHSENGVTIGTTLQQMETLNGRAFQIEPWVSDLGGNVVSWQGGKLAGIFGDGANWRVGLTLGWQELPGGATPQQQRSLTEMDRQEHCCVSSDLAVRQLHPVVTRMSLEF